VIYKDYFLHFLDRELLETQGVYNRLLEQSIIRDVRFILFNTTGDLILSASFLFESKYAYAVFNEFNELFSNGKFTIAITYDSVKKMISVKQDQYKGREKIFPNYFNDLWHILEEYGVVLVPKREDTTLYIANGMLNKTDYEKRIISRQDIPYITEAVEERGKKAITHHLFEDIYKKRSISANDQETINSLITEFYIRAYMEYFDATIATGLSCGIFKYDYLSTNYPLSDVSFWIKLYKRVGIYQFVCTCNVSTITLVLSSKEQYSFIQSISTWLSRNGNCNVNKRCVSDFNFYKLINSLPKFEEILVEDINSYFERIKIIEAILLDSNKTHIERRGSIMQNKQRNVFVVHGRNAKIKKALFAFLRSINLNPLEWESAVGMTGKGVPTTLEVIETGMRNSGGTIILFTGDDLAKLKEELWDIDEHYDFELQPRQNVLFEAGMAMALYPQNTVIVRVGKLREISDLAGINYVNLSNNPEKRNALITRLKTIGLDINTTGNDWLSAGDFDI